MSVTKKDVENIASLARLKFNEGYEITHRLFLTGELNKRSKTLI